MATESGWGKWARNGRLATVVWAVTFAAWLTLKALKIPVEGLDTVFVIMSGAWVTNLGISTVKTAAAAPEKKRVDADD